MSLSSTFEEINESKANMAHIYNQPDPRQYFHELRKLGYVIPELAKPIFQRLISHLRSGRENRVHLLDLGCSYGVNAALLKHDLSMPDLYNHWDNDERTKASSGDIIQDDQQYFRNLDEPENIEVIGIDQAEAAINFAEETGLLDQGLAHNLEVEPLPASAERDLAQVDLVTSTGCVGYVTEKTFNRLLPAITKGRKPWIANFVLRMFPYDPIEATLNNWGYVTEKLEGQTFVQRRFASDGEQDDSLEQLREREIDPQGKETEGHLLAEFYLSRPTEEVKEVPIQKLVV